MVRGAAACYTPAMVETRADILIVGAGIAGAATAYHLQRSGRFSVLIVEKEETAGGHSTGRNAALIREHVENPRLQELTTESAEFLRTGELASYDRSGLIALGLGDEDLSKYVPICQGKGLWYPKDGVLDVSGLLQSYLAGQEVRYRTEVTAWRHVGRELHVSTNRGEIVCDVLVNAAGPWAGRLGNLPLTPKNRHIFVTAPLDWVDQRWPFVWDALNEYYFRPESGGLLLCPCDETPAEPGAYTEDPARLEELADKIMTHQPGLGDLPIMRSWVGQRTFAQDDDFVIGFDPRDEHVFHVAALGGHGITASYAVGRLAAELIADPAADRTNPFSPKRML
ncbi:MAG: FAD-binding oxidoreductase [Phycisphaerales bacterium]|nr:MAG: FAD-binding oxidoreductase [Phycisphaerales bacterium]